MVSKRVVASRLEIRNSTARNMAASVEVEGAGGLVGMRLREQDAWFEKSGVARIGVQGGRVGTSIHIAAADVELLSGTGLLSWQTDVVGEDRPIHGCLWDFVKIGTQMENGEVIDESLIDDQILAFARRWGVLGVAEPTEVVREAGGGHGVSPSEPTAVWWSYARRFRGVLGCAHALRRREVVRPEDLRDALVRPWSLHPGPNRSTWFQQTLTKAMAEASDIVFSEAWGTIGRKWLMLDGLLTELLAEARIGSCTMRNDDQRLQLGLALEAQHIPGGEGGSSDGYWRVKSLLGALTCQLVAATESDYLYRCDLCHTVYEVGRDERRPREDRRHFCSEACRRWARAEVRREVERRRYARRKAATTRASRTLPWQPTQRKTEAADEALRADHRRHREEIS